MYVCMHDCMYLCMYAFIYLCMHVCMDTSYVNYSVVIMYSSSINQVFDHHIDCIVMI